MAPNSVGVAVGVDLRRKGGEEKHEVTIASVLVGPDGEIVGVHNKHILWDYEYTLFVPGDEPYQVYDTPLGKLGLIICADGILMDTARCLALLGAQVLLNSLNSVSARAAALRPTAAPTPLQRGDCSPFARLSLRPPLCNPARPPARPQPARPPPPLLQRGPDEKRLHIPLRAMENGVWHVSANTVGNPNNEGLLWPWTGGSQVVSPTGEVVAQASEEDEEMVFADIVPAAADSKQLGGVGDDLWALRRPACAGRQVAW